MGQHLYRQQIGIDKIEQAKNLLDLALFNLTTASDTMEAVAYIQQASHALLQAVIHITRDN